MKSDALTDLYAILTAGGRNSGDRSRALPKQAYGDPANQVEFQAERERQRKAKEEKWKKRKFMGNRKGE